jgi:hypothetical protein
MEHKVGLYLLPEKYTDAIGWLNVPKLPWQAILRFRKHHLVSIPATMHLTTPSGRFSMEDIVSVLCLMFLRCKKPPNTCSISRNR